MKETCRRLASVAAVGVLMAALAFMSSPARGQGNLPPWAEDVTSLQNKYLVLWEYFQDANVTQFDLWNNEGDPKNPNDNFFLNVVDVDNDGIIEFPGEWVFPWGSRLFSAPHPPYTVQNPDQTPYCNEITLRVDDQANPGQFINLEFPDDGTAVYGPPVFDLPLAQGFMTPWRFEGNTLVVTQKTSFARDLLRVEIAVENTGTVTRRVGASALLDPFVDNWSLFGLAAGTRSVFLPDTRERIFFEKDYGRPTGTTFTPRDPRIPREAIVFDGDETATPNYVAKIIFTGNGATQPTRVGFVNSLNLFPQPGTWDYDIDPDGGQELRISDIAFRVWWDPVEVRPGQLRQFVAYIGVGVADHGMSDAYVATHTPAVLEGQGFVSAVQTPFALPLVNGNADAQVAAIDAYIQNQFRFSVPNAFAFVELPEGLVLDDTGTVQDPRILLGSLAGVGSGFNDERSGTWTARATGVESGLLPIRVTFGNGFQDSAIVTRHVNVPQGRLYVFGTDWRMFTFPFTFPGLVTDPSVIFRNDDGTPLPSGSIQVVRFNPALNTYELSDSIRAGESYWIRMLNLNPGETARVRLIDTAVPIKAGITDPSGEVSLFTQEIQRGWVQVGNPHPYAIPLRELMVLVGNRFITFDQAVSAGLIRSTLFEYNRLTRQYVQINRDSVLQPGRGVWLFSTASRFIGWPAPYGPGLSITP
jgi:hypothetical protein